MNAGGRRSPLGPRISGLVCYGLMVAVLSLMLGAGSTHSPAADPAKTTTISSAVATAHLVTRPASPDQPSLPVLALVLATGLGFVLVRHRRVAAVRTTSQRRPTGRAPPGPITKY